MNVKIQYNISIKCNIYLRLVDVSSGWRFVYFFTRSTSQYFCVKVDVFIFKSLVLCNCSFGCRVMFVVIFDYLCVTGIGAFSLNECFILFAHV